MQFSVDLRAVVDLLARHVYSSPHVFVREILQNALDATTARRNLDGAYRPAPVRFTPSDAGGDGALVVDDDGIGLTEDEVHDLLATIGGSSKRDQLDLPRQGFLGRFGVGLLSCFVIADRIEVLSRSARGTPPVRFVGYDDGTYETGLVAEGAPGLPPGPGTSVRLVPRADARLWVESAAVERLASLYGGALPIAVHVARLDGSTASVADPSPPWLGAVAGSGRGRIGEQAAWCRRRFGFEPMAIVPLRSVSGGVEGLGFVLPSEVPLAAHPGHLVHVSRMLLGEEVTGVLPEWAFFVRCVLDSTELSPTASREALVEDEALEATRDELGACLRDWMVQIGQTRPAQLAEVLAVHGRSGKALAAHDDDAFKTLAPWLRLETSDGDLTLGELARRAPTILYTPSVDRFRQLAPVARAQGLTVVNGGYTYDRELLDRVGLLAPGTTATELEDMDVVASLESVPAVREREAAAFLTFAEVALGDVDCDVTLRAFDPETLPALLLHDEAARERRRLRSTAEVVDDAWSAVLRDLDDGASDRPTLVCNDRHVLVRRVVDSMSAHPDVAASTVQALYVQAMLLGHHPVRGRDLAMLHRALLALVDSALPPGGAT